MLKISVPATSANLCVGFDTLGMAFNRYNIFTFDKSCKDELVGFEKKYMNDNMVLNTYIKFFEAFNLEYIPVKITLEEENVFPSRGLGSSATCIVAGALAAYNMSGKVVSKEDLDTFVTNIEGHPDNVIPALHGGLCASFKSTTGYEYVKYEVNPSLHFYALVPSFELSTELARKALPKEISVKDAVSNLSRIVNLPYAFAKGDMKLIKELMKDKIHEPYRLPLIKHSKEVLEAFESKQGTLIVSGAGPTLLYISNEEIDISDIFEFKVYSLGVNNEGAIVYEEA